MNKRTIRIITLVAALAVAAVGVTAAKENKVARGKGVPTKSVPFSVTGVFSGSLTGEIVVNGQSIFITNKTSFHKVGKGPVEEGESVSNSAILIGGVMKGKKAIATMIVIGEPEASNDFSQTYVPSTERASGAAEVR